MGSGISLKCKCGKKEELHFGVGMMYPRVYRETLESAKAGEFGERWKELVESEEFMAIDAARYLFFCEECGHWEMAYGFDLYKPKDAEKIRHTDYGIKTVEEWGDVPYVTGPQLERDYIFVEEYQHLCPQCNVKMYKTEDQQDAVIKKLACKDCGEILMRNGFLMWD